MRQLTSIFPHFLASHHPSNLPLKARMFFSSPRIAGFRDFRAKEAQVESENKEHATKKYGKSTKAFGKEATGGGFEVFIFKDCHLMGLGGFHRDVTRPHPKFDREVGEALKFSLLEVGEWLQNYGYFLYVNRFQLLVHIFLFLFLFVYMCEHYFSTYSLTKQVQSIHPKMMVTFCNLDFFCMHKYYIPSHIAAIDIQFIGAQVFNSVFVQQNPAKATTQMQSRKKAKGIGSHFSILLLHKSQNNWVLLHVHPGPLSRWQTSVPNCNVPCVGTRLGKHWSWHKWPMLAGVKLLNFIMWLRCRGFLDFTNLKLFLFVIFFATAESRGVRHRQRSARVCDICGWEGYMIIRYLLTNPGLSKLLFSVIIHVVIWNNPCECWDLCIGNLSP